MKNLTEFKRVLESCKTHQLKLSSVVIDRNGNIIKENDFAPVNHIQSNAFTLLRNGKDSWMEFHKASEWSFVNGTATRTDNGGGRIVFTLETPEFFGL